LVAALISVTLAFTGMNNFTTLTMERTREKRQRDAPFRSRHSISVALARWSSQLNTVPGIRQVEERKRKLPVISGREFAINMILGKRTRGGALA